MVGGDRWNLAATVRGHKAKGASLVKKNTLLASDMQRYVLIEYILRLKGIKGCTLTGVLWGLLL